jgi:hypothetical protein
VLTGSSPPDQLGVVSEPPRVLDCPHYLGEEFEALDCEVVVVSTDEPLRDGETDEQRVERENANTARAVRRQQELAAAALATGQHAGNAGQGNDNIGMLAPGAPPDPQPHQQGNEPRRSRLRARDLLWDFEQDSHEVYNFPQANLGAALTVLGQLEDTPVVRRLQANLHVATAQVEE